MSWQERYKKKLVSAEEAAQKVKSGDIVMTALGLGEPSMAIPTALAKRKDELEDVYVVSALQVRPYPWYSPGYEKSFKLVPGFGTRPMWPAFKEKRADFIPVTTTTVSPTLLRNWFEVDVALLMVTPPNKHGYCNLGLTNFYTLELIKNAKTVIAEVNDQMPVVYGDNWVHIDELDYIFENSTPIPTLPPIDTFTEVEKAIASHVVTLIRDRDNVQLGIGGMPAAIINLVQDRHDLGVITEMLPQGLPDLVEKGIVTNKYKPVHQGVSLATFIMGDQKMLEFVDQNPAVQLYPGVYTNSVELIARHKDIVAINASVEIDFKGQICSESLGMRQISGSGGQFDFVMGAFWAENGRAVNVLPSTRETAEGKVSTIVPTLRNGATVTVHGYYTQYVCTEHGMVDLKGKTYRQRAELLISIAHPDFRGELRREMRRHLYDL